MSSQEWCTIESDPGLFTELIANFGVKNVQVEEIFSLDQNLSTESFGLIFLFKYKGESDNRTIIDPSKLPTLFFAKQVITNACATQAILSVVLNTDGIDIGPELSEFKSFCMDFDAENRGLAISNSDLIKQAHNAFTRPNSFFVEQSKSEAKGDAHHFIAYVPHNGQVYELDGLKRGPILIGSYENNDWLSVTKPAIEARMSKYSESETHFALMSIKKSRIFELQVLIDKLTSRLALLERALETGTGFGVSFSEADNSVYDVAADPDLVSAQVIESQSELETYQLELQEEILKSQVQKEENVRRRHNYVPLIVSLLSELSRHSVLANLRLDALDRARNNRRNHNGK